MSNGSKTHDLFGKDQADLLYAEGVTSLTGRASWNFANLSRIYNVFGKKY